MISAINLSNYIITKTQKMRKSISHLKLQKILYYIQGEHIAIFNKPLFFDEIQSWPYGPVVREVYKKYVSNGAMDLKPDKEVEMPLLSPKEKKLIDRVLVRKLKYSASFLVQATHEEEPWRLHADEVKKGLKPTISNESIRRFFTRAN